MIRINPDFVDAHIGLGMTLQDLGQLEAAEVAYQTAEFAIVAASTYCEQYEATSLR